MNDTELESLVDTLTLASERLCDDGNHETAYHLLAAATYLAREVGNGARLGHVKTIIRGQRDALPHDLVDFERIKLLTLYDTLLLIASLSYRKR